MKPVNRNLADEFHEHSEDGVDAVFARMLEVIGGPTWGGYGEIFDVSENTIKTWRKRGAVSTKYLQGFAEKYGVSLDRLMYGKVREGEEDLSLSSAERDLIRHYRAAPKELRNAARRVLLGGGDPPPAPKSAKVVVGGNVTGQIAEGALVNHGPVNIGNTGRRKK